MVKPFVVPQARLPKILAILMYLELVSRGAVHYIQDIGLARIMGLPTGLIPTALIRPLSRGRTNALNSYLHLSIYIDRLNLRKSEQAQHLGCPTI